MVTPQVPGTQRSFFLTRARGESVVHSKKTARFVLQLDLDNPPHVIVDQPRVTANGVLVDRKVLDIGPNTRTDQENGCTNLCRLWSFDWQQTATVPRVHSPATLFSYEILTKYRMFFSSWDHDVRSNLLYQRMHCCLPTFGLPLGSSRLLHCLTAQQLSDNGGR